MSGEILDGILQSFEQLRGWKTRRRDLWGFDIQEQFPYSLLRMPALGGTEDGVLPARYGSRGGSWQDRELAAI